MAHLVEGLLREIDYMMERVLQCVTTLIHRTNPRHKSTYSR